MKQKKGVMPTGAAVRLFYLSFFFWFSARKGQTEILQKCESVKGQSGSRNVSLKVFLKGRTEVGTKHFTEMERKFHTLDGKVNTFGRNFFYFSRFGRNVSFGFISIYFTVGKRPFLTPPPKRTPVILHQQNTARDYVGFVLKEKCFFERAL